MSDAIVDLVQLVHTLDTDILYSMWQAARRQVSREQQAGNAAGAEAWERLANILNGLYQEREAA